jgi:hypothetical protein
LIARSARGDVRWVAAVFLGFVGTEKRCSAISSCRSAARTSLIDQTERPNRVTLLDEFVLFDCSHRAAMFGGLPPSSSDLSERKALFRHLLLHTARRWGWCSLRSRNLLGDRRREHR